MKPGSFTQLYIHLVFSVKNRIFLPDNNIRPRVFEYMSGIITSMGHKSIIVNGVNDHVHILMALNPSVSISDTVHAVKRGTTLFINKEKLCKGKFSWQEGYGAFSYSRSQLENLYSYIKKHEEHHKIVSFRDEYLALLKKFEVEFDEKFLFEFFDEV